MAFPGGPSVAALAAVGVRRVSVGTALAEAAYTTARATAAAFLRDGQLPVTSEAIDDGALQRLSVRT